MSNVPNLDCMTIDPQELMMWWRDHSRGRKCAEALFPDKPAGFVRATRDLANYASNKATAMQCRLRGDIQTALMLRRNLRSDIRSVARLRTLVTPL